MRTPGPWYVWQLASDPEAYGLHAGKLIVTAENGETEICGVVYNSDDARLIAAAPELLDIVKEMLNWLESMPFSAIDTRRIVQVIEKVGLE